MKLQEVKEVLGAEVMTGNGLLSKEVTMACGADLMSDVLAYAKPGAVLLTGLTNPQVVRTAEMADLVAICFVRGKRPDEDSLRLASSLRLPLLGTTLPMFESCGRLYKQGLQGVSERTA
jgi:predicted transcriptional regulator